MYGLQGDTYIGTVESRFFPGFSSSMLLEVLDLGKTQGQTEALRVFRQQIRARGER
jgi:hypothetical protein